MAQNHITYRHDIDGLRAVAVCSVFVFHLDKALLQGGFTGVDVFFVISGFLITRLLITDLDTGALSIARFYQRRIARLFPVMLLVIAATLIGAAYIYSPQDLASAGVNSVAALLSVANIKFLIQGDYFEISSDAQPLLHFWSLSVEEQFYLFFPALMIWLYRLPRVWVIRVIGGLSLGSFLLCVALSYVHIEAAFYLLPTRAWELGVGALVAIRGAQLAEVLPVFVMRWLAFFGLAAIVLAFVLLDSETLFPGYAAALPVLGAAAVLLATERSGYVGQGLLKSWPMVKLGLVSYSLYLWHWPVFSLTDYALYDASRSVRISIKVVLTLGLTALTFFVIERPSRQLLNRPALKWSVIAGFVVVVVAWVPLGINIRTENYVNARPEVIARGGLSFPGPYGAPHVMLIGDSQGSMYARLLRQISEEQAWHLTVASAAAGDSLPKVDASSSRLWTNIARLIAEKEPDVLVMANAWSSKLRNDQTRLKRALEIVAPHTQSVLIINELPALPEGVNRQAIRDGLRGPFFEDEAHQEARIATNKYIEELVRGQRYRNDLQLILLDVSQKMLNADGSLRFSDEAGRQFYNDRTHLSHYGALLVRDEIIAEINSLTSKP